MHYFSSPSTAVVVPCSTLGMHALFIHRHGLSFALRTIVSRSIYPITFGQYSVPSLGQSYPTLFTWWTSRVYSRLVKSSSETAELTPSFLQLIWGGGGTFTTAFSIVVRRGILAQYLITALYAINTEGEQGVNGQCKKKTKVSRVLHTYGWQGWDLSQVRTGSCNAKWNDPISTMHPSRAKKEGKDSSNHRSQSSLGDGVSAPIFLQSSACLNGNVHKWKE